jgi:hypothetical protein
MSDIDRSRIEAVRLVAKLGYIWDRDSRTWRHPAQGTARDLSEAFIQAADAMHGELVGQLEDMTGAPDDMSTDETLQRLGTLIEAYEAARPER